MLIKLPWGSRGHCADAIQQRIVSRNQIPAAHNSGRLLCEVIAAIKDKMIVAIRAKLRNGQLSVDQPVPGSDFLHGCCENIK